MFELVLEKAEEPEIKLPTSAGSWKKQESSRKTSIPALLTMPKPLTVDHIKLWKMLKEMGIPDHRSPAPADPGSSKGRRRQRLILIVIKDIKSNRMRIAQ